VRWMLALVCALMMMTVVLSDELWATCFTRQWAAACVLDSVSDRGQCHTDSVTVRRGQ
jgi:hypothetical protein